MTQATVTALTEDGRAGQVIEQLAERDYFSFRLAGPEAAYRYHPLFQPE